MAQDKYAAVRGMKVATGGKNGPFQACRRCDSREGIVGPGISTHPGHLMCAGCGRHLSWIGASHMDALLASVQMPPRKAGGRK